MYEVASLRIVEAIYAEWVLLLSDSYVVSEIRRFKEILVSEIGGMKEKGRKMENRATCFLCQFISNSTMNQFKSHKSSEKEQNN